MMHLTPFTKTINPLYNLSKGQEAETTESKMGKTVYTDAYTEFRMIWQLDSRKVSVCAYRQNKK